MHDVRLCSIRWATAGCGCCSSPGSLRWKHDCPASCQHCGTRVSKLPVAWTADLSRPQPRAWKHARKKKTEQRQISSCRDKVVTVAHLCLAGHAQNVQLATTEDPKHLCSHQKYLMPLQAHSTRTFPSLHCLMPPAIGQDQASESLYVEGVLISSRHTAYTVDIPDPTVRYPCWRTGIESTPRQKREHTISASYTAIRGR